MPLRPIVSAPRPHRPDVPGFAGDEDGSFVLFGVYLLMAMLLVGGVGVDILRHDYTRLQMQGTVDSAILAAADLDQRLVPEDVVRDYFAKAGILDRLDRVEVVENFNSRVVTATASMDVDSLFISAVGIESMMANAAGTAREDVRDIEVSMVLDISGSMKDEGRIGNLKTAARSFVTTVLADRSAAEREDEVSISLVPYAAQVSVGPRLRGMMNLRKAHPFSSCVDFGDADFDEAYLDLATRRTQTGHFDAWSRASNIYDRAPQPLNLTCRNDDAAAITYFSQNEEDLHDRIDALIPGGNTSIDIGMKWGAALLDPSMRDASEALADAGDSDPAFADRPYDHGRENSMKVMVVMTDGANTAQYALRDEFAGSTPTNVYAYQHYDTNNSDGDNGLRLSIKDREYYDQDRDLRFHEDWWIPKKDRWWPDAWGGSDARQLTYAELWNISSLDWHARFGRYAQYNNSSTFNHWRYQPYYSIGTNTKDDRMERICAAAKDEGILVFTVALDIDEADAVRMKDCASSENHYFNVTGSDIVYAFTAIAGTINQLRLIQ